MTAGVGALFISVCVDVALSPPGAEEKYVPCLIPCAVVACPACVFGCVFIAAQGHAHSLPPRTYHMLPTTRWRRFNVWRKTGGNAFPAAVGTTLIFFILLCGPIFLFDLLASVRAALRLRRVPFVSSRLAAPPPCIPFCVDHSADRTCPSGAHSRLLYCCSVAPRRSAAAPPRH